MLRPSYSELMEKLNNQKRVDSEITSRYTIVLAVAKRARQIIDGANPLTYAPTDRAVSIAVKELDEGKLNIKADPERLELTQDHLPAALYYPGITSVSKDDLRENFKDRYTAEIGVDDEDDIDDEDNYKNDDEDDFQESPYKDNDIEEDYKEDDDDSLKGDAYKDDDFKDDEYQGSENSFDDDDGIYE